MAQIVYPRTVFLPQASLNSDETDKFIGCGEMLLSARDIVVLNSFMFYVMARRCDAIILDGKYFHNSDPEHVRSEVNAVAEARSYGCRIIIHSLKPELISESMRESALTYLKEFSSVVGDRMQAIGKLADYLDSSKKEHVVASGHARVGKDFVVYQYKNTRYEFPYMSGVAVPHPFDQSDIDQKLRFIFGYGKGEVVVCGFTRDGNAIAGYAVGEGQLDLPKGWKSQWQASVIAAGGLLVQKNDWTFAVTDNIKAKSIIIGGKDFQIGGKNVVQRVPFCLCLMVDSREVNNE